MRIRWHLFGFALLLCVGLFSSGCSKKTSVSDGSPSILERSVLDKLPSSTFAFYVWETTSKAFQEYRKGPLYTAGDSYIKQLQEASFQRPELKTMGNVLLKLSQSKLFRAEPGKPDAIAEGLIFGTLEKGAMLPAFGAYLHGTKSVDMQAELKNLLAVFQSEGFRTADRQIGSVSGFTLHPPENPALQGPGTQPEIFLAAQGSGMALSSSESVISDLFSAENGGGYENLKGQSEFQRLMKNYKKDPSGYFNVMYADVQPVLNLLMATGVPTNEIPVKAVSGSRRMTNTLHASFSLLVSPKGEMQQGIFKELSSAVKDGVLEVAPANTLIFLSLNKNVLSPIKKNVLAQLPAEEKATHQKLIDVANQTGGIGLGIGGLAPGSLFPGMVLVSESANAAGVVETLKGEISTAATTGGMPLSPWQSKQVAGQEVAYMLSPLGVGLYILPLDNYVVIASNEATLQDVMQVAQQKQDGLTKTLAAEQKKQLKNHPPLLAFHADFAGIADTAESLQGSISMFTGGTSSFDPSQLQDLRKAGQTFWMASLDQDVLEFQGSYQPVLKK